MCGSWFSRLFGGKGEAGFLVRDGHELRWDRADLPLNVVLTDDAAEFIEDIASVVRDYNAVIGRVALLFPETAIGALRRQFEDPVTRPFVKQTILVRRNSSLTDLHGHSDFRYDTKTGRIGNVIIDLPMRQALGTFSRAVVKHEFGHALGLDHDESPESLMKPTLSDPGQILSAADEERLRKAYGL